MSATFAREATARDELNLVCDRCGQHVCTVEAGDDLDVIVQTAQDHDDECEGR